MTDPWAILAAEYKTCSSDRRDEIFALFQEKYIRAANKYSYFKEDRLQECWLALHESLLLWHPGHKVKPISKFLFNSVKWAALQGLDKEVGYGYYAKKRRDRLPDFISFQAQDGPYRRKNPLTGKSAKIHPALLDGTKDTLEAMIEDEEEITLSPLLRAYFECNGVSGVWKRKIYTPEYEYLKDSPVHDLLHGKEIPGITPLLRMYYVEDLAISKIAKMQVFKKKLLNGRVIALSTYALTDKLNMELNAIEPRIKNKMKIFLSEIALRKKIRSELNVLRKKYGMPSIRFLPRQIVKIGNKKLRSVEWQRNHTERVHEYYIQNKHKDYVVRNTNKYSKVGKKK